MKLLPPTLLVWLQREIGIDGCCIAEVSRYRSHCFIKMLIENTTQKNFFSKQKIKYRTSGNTYSNVNLMKFGPVICFSLAYRLYIIGTSDKLGSVSYEISNAHHLPCSLAAMFVMLM